MTKLTAKQELFCKEYLVDLNATQAAIRAGYSENTSSEMGYENLNKPQIQSRIQELSQDRADKLELSIESVVKDILETREQAAKDDRLSERLKANEMLGRHLKMFTDKIDLDATVSISDKLADMDDPE